MECYPIDDIKGEFHRELKKILKSFQKKYSNKLTIHNKTFKITSGKSGSKSVVEYNPDFILKFKTGKRSFEFIIFEFIDKQADIKTMADIIRTVIIGNCRKVIFLVNSQPKHKEVDRISDVLIEGILDLLEYFKDLLGVKSEKKISKEDLINFANIHIPLKKMNKSKIEGLIFEEVNKVKKLK